MRITGIAVALIGVVIAAFCGVTAMSFKASNENDAVLNVERRASPDLTLPLAIWAWAVVPFLLCNGTVPFFLPWTMAWPFLWAAASASREQMLAAVTAWPRMRMRQASFGDIDAALASGTEARTAFGELLAVLGECRVPRTIDLRCLFHRLPRRDRHRSRT